MAKKAPFFSHDMNARHDPKISAMRGVYGSEGYGWFWMLIEMMAESDGYQLDCKSKYTFNAYATQLQCKAEEVKQFVTDCIEEFELFEADGEYFWSNSLRKRMQYRDAVSEKRAEAANKRWEKQQSDANASKNDANAMQKNANKTKQNKTLKDIADSDECGRQFERFWNVYPNKKGKAQAMKKWASYGKTIDIEKVIDGTQKYIMFCQATDRPYKDGSTFVNQKSWDDDWTIPTNKVRHLPQSRTDTYTDHKIKLQQQMEERNEYTEAALNF